MGPLDEENDDNYEQGDVSDFIEREDWSPTYHKLGYFLLFLKFVTGLVQSGLMVEPQV